jgi:hypothetical protein
MTDTLNNIIKEYLIETGETGENKYARFYQLGVAYLREANIDKNGIIKVVSLSINSNDTANLPSDFIDYTNIGIIGTDGQMHSLGRNDKLSLLKVFDDCGDEIKLNVYQGIDPPNGTYYPYYPYNANWKNGELVGRFFGIGGGNNVDGEFKIDINNRLILIKRVGYNIQNLVLEYIADINVINGDFQVHPYLIEPLKAWLYWKSIQRNTKMGLGEKQMAEMDYIKADKWARRRFTAYTPKEWAEAFRTGNVATTKW